MSKLWSFTARWVFPVASPPVQGAIVLVEGDRIVAIEPAGSRRVDRDLGNVAVLPGLVNAHTHLDLCGMRMLAPPVLPLPVWLRKVVGHRQARSSSQVAGEIRAGLAECLRFGTTLVGDISGDGASWAPLALAPIRAVVFRELLGLTEERAEAAWDGFAAWRAALAESTTCRPGVSPHAPYSVRASLFARAADANLPLMTHLAETRDEMELLAERRGPFVDFLQQLGVWDPVGLSASAAEVVRSTAPAPKLLLAHGNYLGGEALPSHATVVYCPRTHRAFGHDRHPLESLLARGVRVALGTDSLASSPDLDLLAEARLVRQLYPALPGETILRMATLSGAEALGWADETGSLASGKSADVVAVEIGGGDVTDPHDLVLGATGGVNRVLFKGCWVYG